MRVSHKGWLLLEMSHSLVAQGSCRPHPRGAGRGACSSHPHPFPPDNKIGEKQELCRVFLVAVFPLLSILNICSMGSAEGITRRHLWHLFSLDLLNSYLERDPTPQELTYKVPTRHR